MIPKKHLLVIILLFLFIFLDSYNVTRVGELWDELGVALHGEVYLGALKNRDFSSDVWDINHEHPPVAKYIYGASQNITKRLPILQSLDPLYHPDKRYSFSRMVSVLLSALTALVLYLMSWEIKKSRRTALFSALFLFLNPVFLAYSNTVTLEVPLLLFSSFFAYFFFIALKKNKPSFYVLSAVFLGLALSSRYNGLFLLVFYGLMLLVRYGKKLFNKANIYKIFIPLLSFLLLYLIWPYLWHSPFSSFRRSIDRGFEVQTEELFLGSFGIDGVRGLVYYPVYFLVTTSIPLLFLFLFFLLQLKGKKFDWEKIFLLLWFLTPFLAILAPLKQDGIRYVQFMVAPLAMISAVSFESFLEKVNNGASKVLLSSLILILLAFPVVRFYPYYLDYYNILSGGVGNVYRKNLFELGWWGEGSYRAGKYISDNIPEGSTVYINFAPSHVFPNIWADIKLISSLEDKPDYVISNIMGERVGDYSKEDLDAYMKSYRVVDEERLPDGVPLYRIYEKI